MLSSSKDIVLKVNQIANYEKLTEEKQHGEQQAMLYKLFIRQISKCAGRGAMGLGTTQTITTETLKIPKIVTSGVIPQIEGYISLEFKEDAPVKEKDLLLWPEFHNGVAAALRIAF